MNGKHDHTPELNGHSKPMTGVDTQNVSYLKKFELNRRFWMVDQTSMANQT